MSNDTTELANGARSSEEFAGLYLVKRDGGLLYNYEAFWTAVGNRIFWSARISHNGQPKGQPTGVIRMMGQATPHEAIRKLVEFSIENLSQIAR